MSRTSQIARHLLGAALPASDISDLVYRHATIQRTMTMPTEPSEEISLRAAKNDGWVVAVSIAQSSSNPVVLTKLSRDSRRQVRRAVAENKATSEEVLRYLFTWAVKNSDVETMTATTRRCDLDWLLADEQVGAVPGNDGNFPWTTLIARVIETDHHLQRYLELSKHGGDVELAKIVVFEPRHGLTLESLCDRWYSSTSTSKMAKLVEAAWSSRLADATAEMARVLVKAGSEAVHYNVDNHYSGHQLISEAIDILIDSPVAWHREVVTNGSVLLPRQIDALLDKNGPRELLDNLFAYRKFMTAEQIERVVGQMASRSDVPTGESLLSKDEYYIEGVDVKLCDDDAFEVHFEFKLAHSVELTPATVMVALRNGSSHLTCQWLTGQLVVTPLPGQFTELLAKPGRAFRSSYGYWSNPNEKDATLEDIARSLVGDFERMASQPWVDEVVEGLSGGFFSLAERDEDAAAYLATKLSEGIGTGHDAWELALGLLENFDGSVATLVSTVRRLSKANNKTLVGVE